MAARVAHTSLLASAFLIHWAWALADDPEGITKLPDGTMAIEDSAFPLTAPTGSVEKEAAASGGSFVRLNGKYTWGIQVALPEVLLEKGREYQVLARIRVKPTLPEKDNWAGAIGVHDYTSNNGVGHHSFKTAALGLGWNDFSVLSFIPTRGNDTRIWVGTESHCMEYIDVDWFRLIPQPFPALDAYRERLKETQGAVGLFVRAGACAVSGLELVAVKRDLAVRLYVGTSSDPNLWREGWAGLAVDYYVPGKGYCQRTLYTRMDSFGRGWRGTVPASLLPSGMKPDRTETVPLPGDLTPGTWGTCSLDLASRAPPGWEGRLWLMAVARGTRDSTSLGLVFEGSASKRMKVIGTWLRHSEDSWDDYALLDAPGRNLKEEIAANTMALLSSTLERRARWRRQAHPRLVVRIEPPTRLVYRDQPRLAWADSDRLIERIRLLAARNEYESAQIVLINPGKSSVSISRAKPGDLKCVSGKATIPSKDIAVSLVDSVFQGDRETGMWVPDPLPLFRRIELAPGKHQAIWVTVRVGAHTQPGKYEGSLTVQTAGAGKIAVPVALRVTKCALPEQSRLRTAFWFAPQQAQAFYRMKAFTVDDLLPYLDLMAAHRISLSDIALPPVPRSEEFPGIESHTKVYRERDGRFSFDFSNYDKLIAALHARKMNSVNLNLGCSATSGWEYFDIIDRTTGKAERYPPGASWENRSKWLPDEEMEKVYWAGWLASAWKRYKDKYKDMLYFQGTDEPQENRGDYDMVVRMYTKAAKYAPGLPRLITKGPVEKMSSVVDLWCPLDVFFDPAAAKAEQEKGKGVWWYVIGHRLSLGLAPLEARTLPWTTFKYHLSGLLYWGVNAYWTRDVDPKRTINLADSPVDRWPNRPWVLPGNPPHDQTGLLIYPGPDGPVSSVRLENLRDGVEEYDLLSQLQDKVRTAESRGATSSAWYQRAREMVTVPEEVAPDRFRCLSDPKRMEFWREKLLSLLESDPL